MMAFGSSSDNVSSILPLLPIASGGWVGRYSRNEGLHLIHQCNALSYSFSYFFDLPQLADSF